MTNLCCGPFSSPLFFDLARAFLFLGKPTNSWSTGFFPALLASLSMHAGAAVHIATLCGMWAARRHARRGVSSHGLYTPYAVEPAEVDC